jgi:hypothetical protein
MSRKIISPEILEKRMMYMNTKSIWYYIEMINYGLQSNQVEPDGIIKVKLKYNIDSNFINQIVEMYETAGWAEINITFTGTDSSLYGTTEFEFVPPVLTSKIVRKKIRQNL